MHCQSIKCIYKALCFTSFSQQISKLQDKVKSRFGFLYHNHSSFTPAAKLTLIQMTMLDYGDIIYSKVGLERIDVLYLSAMLLIGHITALNAYL